MNNRFFTEKSTKGIALLLALILVFCISLDVTLSYIVTGSPTVRNTFVSGLDPEGVLIVRKSVEHNLGSDYVIPDNVEFIFQVDLGQEYANQVIKTSQGEKTADEHGTIFVTAKPGASVAVQEVRDGTEVTVKEIEREDDGFSVKDGQATQNTTIVAKKDVIVSFVNTYVPAQADPVNLTVTGIKNLEGRQWLIGDSFTFLLEYAFADDDEQHWTEVGTETTTYELFAVEDPDNPGNTILVEKPNFNRFDFSEKIRKLKFDRPGTYAFRLSEVEGSIGGITYDETISYFDVLVGDSDMDGKLEIQNVTGSSNVQISQNSEGNAFDVSVTISNNYAPEGSAEALIYIQKEMEDRSGQQTSPAGYVFELYDSNGEFVKVSNPTTAAGETNIKLVFNSSQAGQDYVYVLKEVGCGNTINGVTFDNTEHKIHVSVRDNYDGSIRAFVFDEADAEQTVEPDDNKDTTAIVIPEGAGNSCRVAFRNVYNPKDASVVISGIKSLDGRELKAEEFHFVLYESNPEFIENSDDTPIATAKNAADGSFCFMTLAFDEVGTYHYIVKEDPSAKLGGIIYDASVFHATITVTDLGGELAANCLVTDILGNSVDLAFKNTYVPAQSTNVLQGKKVFHGGTLKANMFKFELYEANANFEALGSAISTAKNNADGEFSFEPIEHCEAGTYYYLVKESSSAPAPGVIYDDTVYGVTVTVSDNLEGQLTTSLTIQVIGGAAVNEIVFENTYVPPEPTEPSKPTDPTKPVDPTKPTEPKPTDPDDPDSPKTGDAAPIALFSAILFASAICLVMLYWSGKRYRGRFDQ